MSTGALYTLINNVGAIDQILFADKLLKNTLDKVYAAIAANPKRKNRTPTVADIEQTHYMFVSSHFKPHVATAMEYQKVSPSSGGNQSLGGTLKFNLTQFGDFYTDMVLYVKFNKAVYKSSVSAPNQNAFRYCDWPGERLIKKSKFSINSNILDEYYTETYVNHRQFHIAPGAMPGWHRMMGQEMPNTAYLQQNSQTQPTNRVAMQYYNGYQTPKGEHEALTLMIPLQHWFNKDPRLAFPSVSIPNGTREIELDLCAASDLIEKVSLNSNTIADDGEVPNLTINNIYLYINNIFMNPDIHLIFIRKVGFTLIRVHKRHNQNLDKDSDKIQLVNLVWPVESLYVSIKPIANTKAKAFPNNHSLQDWHKTGLIEHKLVELDGVASNVPNTNAIADIDQFKAVCAAPAEADVATQLAAFAAIIYSTRHGAILMNTANTASTAVGATPLTMIAAINNIVNNVTDFNYPTISGKPAIVEVAISRPVTDSITIQAQNSILFDNLPSNFFNSYVPFVRGSTHLKTPEDNSQLYITFAMYPGAHQPSGHFNVSRSREFFLSYIATDKIGNDNTGDPTKAQPAVLLVDSMAINFLLVSDGSAVLRYAN